MSHCCGGCGGAKSTKDETKDKKAAEAPKSIQPGQSASAVGVFDPSHASK